MVNMTLAIPKELHALMKKHSDVKWSEVARRAISEQVKKLEWMDHLLKNSKVTDEDITKWGHETKKKVFERIQAARNARIN